MDKKAINIKTEVFRSLLSEIIGESLIDWEGANDSQDYSNILWFSSTLFDKLGEKKEETSWVAEDDYEFVD